MLSRRTFLVASFGLLLQPDALAAKKKKVEVRKLGPHTLAREQWPPAISPDFISIVDKGFALLSDQSGRLAIVDFKREEGPQVIGELTGLGKKTVDMAVVQGRAYALAYQEAGSDAQHHLVSLSILPSADPTILSHIPLPYLVEPVSISASADAVAVAGVGPKGENQVYLFGINSRKRPDEKTQPSAVINFEQPVTQVELANRQLLVLQSGRVTQLDIFNLFSPRNPEKLGSLRLDGNYTHMVRTAEAIVLGGQNSDRKLELLMITARATPRVVSRVVLPASEIHDIGVQKGQLLVLVNQINRQAVLPVSYNTKALTMALAEGVMLPAGNRGAASKARIAVREREAYVASDTGGVHVLNISKSGWQFLYSHTIPRLPAAAIAVAGNRAVLAGSDLKVYDITQPDHPVVFSTTELGSTVRAVCLVGNAILALTRDGLTMRRLERPSEIVGTVKLTGGQALTYDTRQQRAYVLSGKDKTTVVTPVRVSATLAAEKPHELPGLFNHASAANGMLLVSGLNNLALYALTDTAQLIGSRNFPNLALRSLSLNGDIGTLTAVNSNSRGYLLTVNTCKADLPTVGSIDLPQDGVALAVSGKMGVVVGRSPDGKALASLIDLSSSIAPKVTGTFPVVEAASAVAIKDKLAIVVGRGLEILSLT